MYSNGIADITQRERSLEVLLFLTKRFCMTEASDLSIDDGPSHSGPFTAFDSEPPPAPKLHSIGVIATDITAQFTHAAQRNKPCRAT